MQLKKWVHCQFILYALLLILIIGCAQIKMPSGGAIDTTPPKITECIPENESVNFKAQEFKIYFDEFIKVNDLYNQLIVSPPLNRKPEGEVRGKSLLVKFSDTLRPNTTYTFYFGNAIADITEGNILTNYKYVFSTGAFVDSLSLYGAVRSANSLEPVEDILVMLYSNNHDSVPYLERPAYAVKTDKNGEYRFNNISPGYYLLFALKDANANYIFDLPNEWIAFYDTLIKPAFRDTLSGDSLVAEKQPGYDLYLFEESDSIQRISSSSLIKNGHLQFVFRFPCKKPEIRFLNKGFKSEWLINAWNKKRDTLNVYIKNKETDTLKLVINDIGMEPDTMMLSTTPKARTRKGITPTPAGLALLMNVRSGGNLNLNQQLEINYSYPVERFDFDSIVFVEGDDTIVPNIFFTDTIIRNKALISHSWKENQSYKLKILPGAFTDIRGNVNDSLHINFNTPALEDYGNLLLGISLKDLEGQYIIQLLNENGDILRERVIKDNVKVSFDYLLPGKYKIKAIHDINTNGHWDTGNYLQKIQPERIIFFSQTVQVRANWDIEYTWEL